MDLDWITLYDYMTILSRTELKQKINKFYESFYPLKFKKDGRKKIQFRHIERGGLLGIIATYIDRVLTALKLYIEAEHSLSQGKEKEQLKLCKMFVQIEIQNLHTSLRLEKTVYVIQESYKYYVDKEQDNKRQKVFLEIKLLASLKRLFEFYYTLDGMKDWLQPVGYNKMYAVIQLNSIQAFQKAEVHLKLFPQLRDILIEILKFFAKDEKQPFNFHAHLTEDKKKSTKKNFQVKVKKMISMIPNLQKQLFLNLSDQNFYQFLIKSGLQIPKQPIQNYFRSEEQINSLVAQEEHFLESIIVPQTYRGKPQWKKAVIDQMVNLSTQFRKTQQVKMPPSNRFKSSQDFPLFLS